MDNETPPIDGTLPLTDAMGNVIYGSSDYTPVEPPKPVQGDTSVTNDPLLDVQTKLNEPPTWLDEWGLSENATANRSIDIDRESRGLPPPTFGEERKSEGFVPPKRFPTEDNVQTLRENQNNPQAVKAYEFEFGEGSSKNVLKVPPMKDILRLIANMDKPEARDYFDKMYGYTSKLWIGLMSRDEQGVALATPDQRKLFAQSLNRIYNGDRTLADRLETSSAGEFIRSFALGSQRAIQELGQSAGIVQDDFVPNDVMPQDHPIISGFIGGLSQFGTAQGIGNVVLPGGNLKGAYQTLRQMGIGGLADAFGTDPNDPYAFKSMGELFGLPQEVTDNLPDPAWFETDAGKRAMRAVEGGVLGVAAEGIIKVIRSMGGAVYEFRTGNIARAEAAKAAAEAELERLAAYSERVGPQRPQVQLDLDLGDMNNPDKAVQLRLQRVDEANAGKPMPTEQPTLPMDLPTEGRLDKLPDFVSNPPRPESMSSMEERLLKSWGIDHQLKLDLPEPPTGPIAREGQGELFGDIGLPNQTRPVESTGKPAEAPPATGGTTPAPKVETPVLPTPAPRLEAIGDAINGTTREERLVRNIVDPPRVNTPTSIRTMLDNMETLGRAPFTQVRALIQPFIDEFIEIARRSPDELETALSYNLMPDDRFKLKPLVATAVARTEAEALDLADQLVVAKDQKVTDARRIADLERQIKNTNDLLANLQILEKPLGSEAGYYLKLEQLERKIAAKFRPDVAKLRAAGMSEEAINRAVANAFDRTMKNDLRALYAEREAAKKANDPKKLAKAEKRLKKEIEKVEKALDKETKNLLTKMIETTVELRAVGLTAGMGTLARSIVTGLGLRGLDRVFENIGLFTSGRIGKQFSKAEVIQVLKAQDEAKDLAIDMAFSSQLDYIAKTMKLSAKDALAERSTLNGSTSGDRNVKAISSTNYGVDPTSVTGKAVDYTGRGIRGLLLPATLSDETFGNLIKRAEVAKDAGYDFMANLADRKATAKAKLRDPNLSKVEQSNLKAEIAELNDWRNAKVNGKSFKDYVEDQVKSKSDAEGRIIDQKAIDRANYILLRSAPTGPLGREFSRIANMGGGVGRLVQPFLTNPMNGFKRFLETTPLARLPGFKALNDLADELNSTDPRTHARAVGKFYAGWAITAFSMMSAYYYMSQGSPPRDRNGRLMMDASSAMQGLSVGSGDFAIDIGGLEPFSTHIVLWANLFSNYRKNIAKYEDERRAAEEPALDGFDSMYQDKAPAVFWATLAATANAIVDTGNMEGVKQITDALNVAWNSSDDTESLEKSGKRFAQNFLVTTLIPATFRQFSNVIDPKRVDPDGFLQALYSSVGIKDGVPLVRDFLGRPIETKTPWRSVVGPFVPQTLPENDNLAQDVVNQLTLQYKATGKSYALPVYPPEGVLRSLDLMKFKSVTGDRSVYDVYGDNLTKLKIPSPNGKMQTLPEALHDVMTIGPEKYGLSMGFAGNPGKEADVISNVINRYRKQAWSLTKAQEKNNEDLVAAVNREFKIDAASQNKKNDAQLPFVPGLSP